MTIVCPKCASRCSNQEWSFIGTDTVSTLFKNLPVMTNLNIYLGYALAVQTNVSSIRERIYVMVQTKQSVKKTIALVQLKIFPFMTIRQRIADPKLLNFAWEGMVQSSTIINAIVLIFCVELQELSHLTRDLAQAEKKINVVTSWANVQNDIYFTQNGQSCHFAWK